MDVGSYWKDDPVKLTQFIADGIGDKKTDVVKLILHTRNAMALNDAVSKLADATHANREAAKGLRTATWVLAAFAMVQAGVQLYSLLAR